MQNLQGYDDLSPTTEVVVFSLPKSLLFSKYKMVLA